jgi:hypothetical protein
MKKGRQLSHKFCQVFRWIQVHRNFTVEWLKLQSTGPPDLSSIWTMYLDGSKRVEGAGAGEVLISPQGDKLKYVLDVSFP